MKPLQASTLACSLAAALVLSACGSAPASGGGRITGVTGSGTTTTIPPGGGATATGTSSPAGSASAPSR
jgi:hypothetical protein